MTCYSNLRHLTAKLYAFVYTIPTQIFPKLFIRAFWVLLGVVFIRKTRVLRIVLRREDGNVKLHQ